MATITSDVYLDSGTTRSAGESWTCNGGVLKIRTDTRWHGYAPADMVGSLGSVTISSTAGGGYEIDGRNVRWLPFDSGTGNVPSIGSIVSQVFTYGYLLGVWPSLSSAPSAVGSAMPSSGFLKFREISNGSFSVGALGGIGASATGPDVVGWIEVVHDQAAAITVPRLGKFQVRGDWFALGVTTGTANQLVQIPTNGSSTTYVPGVWIETGVDTGIYEFWPSLHVSGMTTTNLGADIRSKFVCMETDGKVRIGHNGTVAVGYVPVAGCRIRIPNVFGRQCTTAARATNAIPNATAATRPDFVTTSAGAIDIEFFASDWYLLFAQPYSVKLHHVATFDFISVSECASALDIKDGGNGTSQSIDAVTLSLTSNFAGGVIEDWVCDRYSTGANDHAASIGYCKGQKFNRVRSGIITYARTTSGVPFYFNLCSDLEVNDCRQYNGQMTLNTCSDCVVNDLDHVDRYVGATNTTSGIYSIFLTNFCNNIKVDGLTFGHGGLVGNCHPYSSIFGVTASSNIKIRNIGARSAFLNAGSANNPAYIYYSGGNNENITIQRCYVSPLRTGTIMTLNSDKNMVYESVFGDFADTVTLADLNSVAKGCGGTNTTTGQASVYGTHFWDVFVSDTVGRVVLSLNEPTAETSQYINYVSVAAGSGFTSAGNISLGTVGDEVIIEMSYFAKGHTGLSNTAPVITGINVSYSSGARWGNHDIYYQIDTGNGWNGEWKDFIAANLSGESISPSIGFKLKYRIVCAVTNSGNLLTYIRIQTDSSLVAQTDNLYPLDVNTLSIVGVPSGCDLVVLSAGTSTILNQQDSVNSTVLSYIYSGAHNVDIGILKPGYVPYYIRNLLLAENDSTIPVSLTIDRNYQ